MKQLHLFAVIVHRWNVYLKPDEERFLFLNSGQLQTGSRERIPPCCIVQGLTIRYKKLSYHVDCMSATMVINLLCPMKALLDN